MTQMPPEAERSLRIETVSDLISPWCFISRRRLDRALAQVRGAVVPDLNWTPYEINPGMPPGGLAMDAYLAGIFGSVEAAQPLLDGLTEAGKADGIGFRFDRVTSVPSTLDAHRLVLRAEQDGCAGELVERLFRAFFEEGLDIGERRVLVELAEAAGMAAAPVEQWLASDGGRSDVLAHQSRILEAGLTGVPGLILNGRVAVLGAQEPEALVQAIDQALFPGLQADQGPVTVH